MMGNLKSHLFVSLNIWNIFDNRTSSHGHKQHIISCWRCHTGSEGPPHRKPLWTLRSKSSKLFHVAMSLQWGFGWKKVSTSNCVHSCSVMWQCVYVCVWARACFVLCSSPWSEIPPHYWRTVNPSAQSYTNHRAQECGSSNHNTNDNPCTGHISNTAISNRGVTHHICITDYDANSCQGQEKMCFLRIGRVKMLHCHRNQLHKPQILHICVN